ncbi:MULTISPECIES: hypothetical protein [Streptomyces]|uniref:Uncharacterized protein n=2 Tax=Streptomyces TaxID=1883 RepID=A0ABV9ITB3_9ACTN
MITTTDAKVMETLRAVVSERPEYTYSAPEYMAGSGGACFYVHVDEDRSPVGAGCAVGVVLHRLGVPLKELMQHEGKTAIQMVREVIEGVSRSTANKLRAFQFMQDGGVPWGEAYAKATGETI